MRFALVVILLAAAPLFSQTTRPSIPDLQRDVGLAQKALREAEALLQNRLDQDPRYRAAREKLEIATSKVEEARAASASDQIVEAATAKLRALEEVKQVTNDLRAKDRGIIEATARLQAATTQLDESRAAEAQRKRDLEQARLRQQEQLRQALRSKYDAVLNRDFRDMKRLTSVPLVGDEANLLLIRARPQDYVNKSILLTGAVRIDDYYNFGYEAARATHYCLDFDTVNSDGSLTPGLDGVCHLYQARSMGDDVINVLANAGKARPNMRLVMRFKVTISPAFVRTFDDARDMYEVLDWQFLGQDGQWTAWHSQVAGGLPPAPSSSDGVQASPSGRSGQHRR